MKSFGIEAKSRSRNGSIFGIVKANLKKENESRTQVVFNVLSEMKAKNIEITEDTYKKVNKLLSNLMTYVRKSYSGYEKFSLIETPKKLQMVSK